MQPTLEIQIIDGISYIYCPQINKYFYWKYVKRLSAQDAMEAILADWTQPQTEEFYYNDFCINFTYQEYCQLSSS